MTIDMQRNFKKSDQIICKEFEEGPVLIDPYRRTLIKLNPTALEIWGLLDGERPVSMIVETIRDRFEVDDETLKKDVVIFLKDLIKLEMIR
jgi:hypothetical protein